MPIFSKRIQEIAVKIPTTETELKFKDLIGRAVRDFHFTEEPFRREQQKNARRVKAEIISTMMCLVVQEKIDQERFQFSFGQTIQAMVIEKLFPKLFQDSDSGFAVSLQLGRVCERKDLAKISVAVYE